LIAAAQNYMAVTHPIKGHGDIGTISKRQYNGGKSKRRCWQDEGKREAFKIVDIAHLKMI
jgi:hypothetical protein